MKLSFKYFIIFSLMLFQAAMLSSCANILPPSGGPRDSLPPKLVTSLPKDSALNISPKNITLTFDEFVTIQDVQGNLIVSPTLKRTPLVDYKLRNVTIKFQDSLETNTTYSLNFGDAIKDVNEGNIAKKFTYVFSTGPILDSLSYRGKVILAETGKIDSSLIVVLHKNLMDTAVSKDRPRYYTRLNGKGEFSFKYLPGGDFNVYVMEGTSNFSRTYKDSTKLFAFKNAPVSIGTKTTYDTLYAYQEAKPKPKTNTATAPAPTKLSSTNKEDKRLRFTTSLENAQQDLLSEFTLTFNRKLGSFDSSKFILTDTNYHQLTGFTVSLDTSKTKVELNYNWKEDTHLRMLIAKDAVADSAGVMLSKSDTLKFLTKKESEYGSVLLRFGNLNLSKNPVLQIVQNDKLIESVVLTNAQFKRKLFRAGTYDLRILFDKNKNGVWDPGKFFGAKRQPEIVQLIPKQLVIRANWDNEVNIQL
jgi:hypothetical protein